VMGVKPSAVSAPTLRMLPHVHGAPIEQVVFLRPYPV